jgi:hypothetical protein
MHSPLRAWSAIVRRQNCSLTASSGLPIRVVIRISRIEGFASEKCYQTLQDGIRYTVTFQLQLVCVSKIRCVKSAIPEQRRSGK